MARETIAGRYRVERPIGRGGMGTVWLCRDQRLGRHVAVKQVGTLPGETAPALARAMREARYSAALNHPHVVSIYDVVEEDDHIWLVLEYVPSRTLAEILADDGPLPPELVVWIGAQVADGLAAAHAVGTVHRDVKPGNILVTADHLAKISDFGIARAHGDDRFTRAGLVTGTPAYFSPELAKGEDPTPAADVWALGATLYAAVEGHPPYPEQRNAVALLAMIASTPPPRPQHARFLTEPIVRMLDPDPRSRWSMVDAAHVLERLHERQARKLTRESTTAFPAPRSLAGAVPVAAGASAARGGAPADGVTDDHPSRPPDHDNHGARGGALLLAGLFGLLALVAVAGFLLFHGGPADGPSTYALDSSSTSTPGDGHSTRNGPRTGSPTAPSTPTTQPTSTSSLPAAVPPTSGSATTSPPSSSRPVPGSDAQQFVRSYYGALPSNTRSAWQTLSPGFQQEIGGYGSYQAFWSTISSVTVDHTARAGQSAVDVTLTYTTDDGSVDHEVRRLYLEREDAGYLVAGDAVVG